MAWPRIKNSRSSALPETHEHNGVQVTVAPAPDADPARESGHNVGVSGTRHSVIDIQSASAQDARTLYADSGADDYDPASAFDETAELVYEEPPDSGIAILEGVVTTEIPVDEPDSPQPELNQPITLPPRPVGPEPLSQPGSFGGTRGESGTKAAYGGQPARIRDLTPGQRIRIWRWRALIVVVVGLVFSLVVSWPVGLTLAVLAGIIDTVYRSRTVASISAGGNPDRAQRRTRRQLGRMRRAGYLTLHARPIPDSPEVIDHLVVGPTGVYAIDSEKWHRQLPIRTRNGRQLWHGPDSKKHRLEHAHWEAQQVSDRLSAALGTEIVVRPAMAIYGPRVPWDIATIRGVDVFSGPALRKYLRRRARMKDLPRLTPEQVRKIYDTAATVLPGVAPTTRSAAPVG